MGYYFAKTNLYLIVPKPVSCDPKGEDRKGQFCLWMLLFDSFTAFTEISKLMRKRGKKFKKIQVFQAQSTNKQKETSCLTGFGYQSQV